MVKTINLTLEDAEFQELKKEKGNQQSWYEFFVGNRTKKKERRTE